MHIKKRLLITGVSGFLGSHLAAFLKNHYQVIGLYYGNRPRASGVQAYRCNVMVQKELTRYITALHPDVIIHAAGAKDVAFCEAHDLYADDFHVGTAAFFPKMRNQRFHLIYVSCAEIFGNNKGQMFTESVSPLPKNTLGTTKRRAEEIIMTGSPRWTVLRLGPLYGINNGSHGSFIDAWGRVLASGDTISCVADRFMTPLYVEDVAKAIRLVIENYSTNELYHLAGPDRVSPYAMALKYARVMGYPESLVKPATIDTLATERIVAKETSLSSEKFTRERSLQPLSVEEGLQLMRKRLETGWTDDMYDVNWRRELSNESSS